MNICIPVVSDEGLASAVCTHFGSAPCFLFVDTETNACRAVVNTNQHHGHGVCHPLAALAGEPLDALVVGGIGMGALQNLQAMNIRVYRATEGRVEETLAALAADKLPLAEAATACRGHGGQGQGQGQGRGLAPGAAQDTAPGPVNEVTPGLGMGRGQGRGQGYGRGPQGSAGQRGGGRGRR